MTLTNKADAPLVAIITPVYNGAAFLRETMECVQAQDYPNLVHVVLDNCSSDGTAEIIADYKDARVPVVTAKNPEVFPLYKNWNAAFDLAPKDAKYVRLLCADDKMSDDCTSRMVEIAETDPEILLVGVNICKNDDPIPFLWPEDQTVMDGKEVVRRFFQNRIGFFAVHMLMRHDVMDWRNPIYDDKYVGADFESVLAILQRGKFGMIHDHLGWVRIHDASETAKTIVKKNTHFIDWLNTLHFHGPNVLTPKEFKQVSRRYEHHYLRRAMRWRRDHGDEAADPHFTALEKARGPITTRDYIGAFFDWLLIKIGARPYWSGWPN